MLFDPIKTRLHGFSDGMLKWQLEAQYDPRRPMGNVASSDLSDVISAWLVGLHGEIAPVLPRSAMDRQGHRNRRAVWARHQCSQDDVTLG